MNLEKNLFKYLIKRNFIKYILIALSSFILDLILFKALCISLNPIFRKETIIFSTIIARIFSSTYNYKLSSHLVFKKYSKRVFSKYILLVGVNMLFSSTIVYLINRYYISNYIILIKITIDGIIFTINYIFQKKIIFK